MVKNDLRKAVKVVEEFLKANGMNTVYSNDKQQGWAVYISLINKSITVHGPTSGFLHTTITKTDRKPDEVNENIFDATSNGAWIGLFRTITDAYAFAELLRRALYLDTAEDSCVALGKGINMTPRRLL